MFKNYLISFLLVFGFCSENIYAFTDQEKEKIVMEKLASYSLAGSALKIITEKAIHALSLSPLDNNTTLNIYSELEPYVYSVFDPTSEFFVKVSDTKVLKEKVEQAKFQNIDASKRYTELSSLVGEIGFGLDILSLSSNSYDMIQNFSKGIYSDGNVPQEALAFGTQNVFETYLAASEIMAQLGQWVPENIVTAFWEKNIFANGFVKNNNRIWTKQLSTISVGAYLESIVYMHFRDNVSEEVNHNSFLRYKNTLESRERIVNQLTELYFLKENLQENIMAEDILTILQKYNVLSTTYSDVPGETYTLTQIFRDLSENISYLDNVYSVNAFADLVNDQKILVALDALKEMSVKEDLEFKSYMNSTIGDNGNTVSDMIVESFQGSSLYDINDTDSLIGKIFLYEGTSYSAHYYYNILYKVAFNSAVATRIQFILAEEGREIKKMKEAQNLKQVENIVFSKFLPITGGSFGDSMAVHFDKYVSYRDELFADATFGLPYYMVYRTEGEAYQKVEATYNDVNRTLVFVSPQDAVYEIYQVLVTQPPRWEGDDEIRRYSYTLPVGDRGVWVENLTDESFGSNGQNTALPLLMTGQTTSYVPFDDGYYQKGIARDYSRSSEGVVTDNVTKLEWQDDYSDNADDIKQAKWQEAIDYCATLSLNGGGWRLPTLEELETIVDAKTGSPAITQGSFTNIISSYARYWSATPYAYNTAYAWYVDFYRGVSNNDIKTDSRTDEMHLHYVRCVRDGE